MTSAPGAGIREESPSPCRQVGCTIPALPAGLTLGDPLRPLRRNGQIDWRLISRQSRALGAESGEIQAAAQDCPAMPHSLAGLHVDVEPPVLDAAPAAGQASPCGEWP